MRATSTAVPSVTFKADTPTTKFSRAARIHRFFKAWLATDEVEGAVENLAFTLLLLIVLGIGGVLAFGYITYITWVAGLGLNPLIAIALGAMPGLFVVFGIYFGPSIVRAWRATK